MWDRDTGEPIYNAIVWQDRRTAGACDALKRTGDGRRIQERTGLLVDAYFSGTKLQWLLDHVPGARARAENGELAFGTIDSWLVWCLTQGQVHATDVSNASRTMLFNLHTLDWDDELLRVFGVPRAMLPEVRPSSGRLGVTAAGVAGLGSGVPISGIAGDQQAAPDAWAQVHPSRLIIMAEGSVGDFLDGVPLLEAGFNHLTDLEKIAGGSAESFLKNSSRTLVFKFDANSAPTLLSNNPEGTQSTRPLSEVLEEKSQALNTSIDASVATAGGEVTTLQTTVADPGPSFEVAANLFAASVQIPFTILFGQQTGRLASDQDRQDFAARCASRQENELTPVLIAVIKRLQDAGIVEAQDFEIEWPRVDAPSEKDRVEILGKMATAAKQHFDAGGGQLFTTDEMRKVVDYEAQVDGEHVPTEGDPDATLTSDPAARSGGAPAPQPRALRQAA